MSQTENIHHLPDLRRMTALAEKIRRSSDAEVAALLATPDGPWLVADCPRYLPSDVSRRLVAVIAAGLPTTTLDAILGARPTSRAREGRHG